MCRISPSHVLQNKAWGWSTILLAENAGPPLVGVGDLPLTWDPPRDWTPNTVEVFVDCRKRLGLAMNAVNRTTSWSTWCVMDGNDTKDSLVAPRTFFPRVVHVKNGFRQFPLKWSQSLEEFLPLWSSRAALRLEFKHVAYIVKVQCCFTTLVEA